VDVLGHCAGFASAASVCGAKTSLEASFARSWEASFDVASRNEPASSWPVEPPAAVAPPLPVVPPALVLPPLPVAPAELVTPPPPVVPPALVTSPELFTPPLPDVPPVLVAPPRFVAPPVPTAPPLPVAPPEPVGPPPLPPEVDPPTLAGGLVVPPDPPPPPLELLQPQAPNPKIAPSRSFLQMPIDLIDVFLSSRQRCSWYRRPRTHQNGSRKSRRTEGLALLIEIRTGSARRAIVISARPP